MRKQVIKFFFTFLVILVSGPGQLIANFSKINTAVRKATITVNSSEIDGAAAASSTASQTIRAKNKLQVSFFEIEEEGANDEDEKRVSDSLNSSYLLSSLFEKTRRYSPCTAKKITIPKHNLKAFPVRALYIAFAVFRI